MIALFLTAWAWAVPVSQAESRSSGPAMQMVAEYEGVLPCADCIGLRTKLTLLAPPVSFPQGGRYTLEETYEGRSVKNSTTGTWKMMRGAGKDKQAVVYQLTADTGKRTDYWLRTSDNELRALDAKRRELPAGTHAAITRVTLRPVTLPGGYRVIPPDDFRVGLAAAFAAGQQLDKNPTLAMRKVDRAEVQVVAGTNFRLCLTVTRDGAEETAETVVAEDLKGVLTVTRWTWGPCSAR